MPALPLVEPVPIPDELCPDAARTMRYRYRIYSTIILTLNTILMTTSHNLMDMAVMPLNNTRMKT